MEQLFRAKHILPQVYKIVLDDAFGVGWIKWLPETCWSEINRKFKVVPVPEVKNKINALKVFLQTDKFYYDAHVFENIVMAVNDYYVDPDAIQLANPEEITYAVRALLPLKDELNPEFGREVIGYIRTSCRRAGMLKYPHMLQFAQPEYDSTITEHLAMIEPEAFDPYDETNIIHVQSLKLWQVMQYVTRKISHLNLQNLEYSQG